MNRLTPTLRALSSALASLVETIEDQDRQIEFNTRKAMEDKKRALDELISKHQKELADMRPEFADLMRDADDELEALSKMHADAVDLIAFLEHCIDACMQPPGPHPEGNFPCYVVSTDHRSLIDATVRVRTVRGIIYASPADWAEPYECKRLAPAWIKVTHVSHAEDVIVPQGKFITRPKS